MEFLLKNFNILLVDDGTNKTDSVLLLNRGVYVDHTPERIGMDAIKALYPKTKNNPLFKTEDNDKIKKTIEHYMGARGTECSGKIKIPQKIIKGKTAGEVAEILKNVAEASEPISDSGGFIKYCIDNAVDTSKWDIKNNEIFCGLGVPRNGDDAVRQLIFMAGGGLLLIKSREVIKAVEVHDFTPHSAYISKYKYFLSESFNRHKKIMMAIKAGSSSEVRALINKISKLSKKNHVPIKESGEKTFLNDFTNGRDAKISAVSTKGLVRLWNLISAKKAGSDYVLYRIRNGKAFYKEAAKSDIGILDKATQLVELELAKRFAWLEDFNVEQTKGIDLALPVSEKQAIGCLPNGTTIKVKKGYNVGIFWKNKWGACDLDLSSVDVSGVRSGWNVMDTIEGDDFSGDVINAPKGAAEFFRIRNTSDFKGFFVNIYDGEAPARAELIIGKEGGDKWIKKAKIKETLDLKSRQSCIGFKVRDKYVLSSFGCGSTAISRPATAALVNASTAEKLTVSKLLEIINYKNENKELTLDLKYGNFSYIQLESQFYNN